VLLVLIGDMIIFRFIKVSFEKEFEEIFVPEKKEHTN